MGRKQIITIGLCLIAIIPVIVGTIQVVDFIDWLLDVNIVSEKALQMVGMSLSFLIFAFVISLLEKFCFYHRLTICATLYANCSCFFMDHYPSILFYNTTNIFAVLLIVAGIIGCLIHFIYQLYDFKRYLRIRKSQQAAR